VAVLLADGWHRIVPGSFSVGPMSFGAHAGVGGPGFQFEEAAVGSPYRPTVLAGPLDSIVAVRQVASVRLAELNSRPLMRTGRRAAEERWQAV